VRLDLLDAELRRSAAGAGLLDVLTRIGGPVRDRRADTAQAAKLRAEPWEAACTHAALAAHERLADWLPALRSSGLIRRLAGDDEGAVLSAALGVLARLPGSGIRLAVLAADVTGDSHALDRRRPVGTVVHHALAHMAGRHSPASAGAWRRAWEEFGVVCDDLSCDVLALNLRPVDGTDLIGGWLRDFAGFGEPVRITLHQLAVGQVEVPSGQRVFVCENPAVVAYAADVFGEDCAPVVCVEGMPTTAAFTLLERLAEGGALLSYHGDFDWGGIRIANQLFARLPLRPWRYNEGDYTSSAPATPSPIALSGAPVPAMWDAGLAGAMTARGIAVFEEQVLAILAADLGESAT
jgi:uncharacterized protein (TIGR02679 family)